MKLTQKHVPFARVSPAAITILCALGATLLATRDARAQSIPVVAIDITHDVLDTTESAGTFAGTPAGTGFDVAVGLRSPGSLWIYTAELTGGFHDFGGAVDPQTSRLMLGSRLGIDWTLRPSIFAHLGIGHVSLEPSQSAADVGTDWAGDLGISLDVSVVSGVEVGLAGSANWVGFSNSFNWLQAGAHVTFVLGG